MEYGVVYKITNNINGKIYIGKTINMHKRHLKYLSCVRNGSSQPIVKAMIKYGVENFTFEVVSTFMNEDELNKGEIYYINKFNSINEGYNISLGGDGGDTMSNHKNKDIIYKKRSAKISGNNSYQYRHDLDEHIKEIIELNSNGLSANDLAEKFNCSEKAIKSRIPNYNKISSSNHNKGDESYQYRHDLDENIEDIKESIKSGMKIVDVCKKYNCSTKSLYKRIKNNKK